MTDHIWFNVPKNLQHGLIEICVLKLLKQEPQTASELIRKIASTMEIWISPSEMLSCLTYMKEMHRIRGDGSVFTITDNGSEKIEDGIHEIAKFVSFIDPTYAIFGPLTISSKVSSDPK